MKIKNFTKKRFGTGELVMAQDRHLFMKIQDKRAFDVFIYFVGFIHNIAGRVGVGIKISRDALQGYRIKVLIEELSEMAGSTFIIAPIFSQSAFGIINTGYKNTAKNVLA